MKYLLVNLCCIFHVYTVYAQISGIVVEKETKAPLPYTSLRYETGGATQNAIAGNKGEFSIANAKSGGVLSVSCIGYKTQKISVNPPVEQLIIELEEEDFVISELLITPGENPAIPIIRKAITNKTLNNFEDYSDYAYQCYFKLLNDMSLLQKADTTSQRRATGTMPLSETLSLCKKSGDKTEDKIIATRAAGMKSSIFPQFSYIFFYKAVSFFNHSVSIFGKMNLQNKTVTDYVSPLGGDALNSYRFFLFNEYVTPNDTVFEIHYSPKSANINGLKGTIMISSNLYAPTSITAEPFGEDLTNFKIKQTYRFVQGRWFPDQLEESFVFNPDVDGKQKGITFRFFVTSKIDSVSFARQQIESENSMDEIYADEKSLKKNIGLIDSIRPIPLSDKEIATYQYMDSVAKKGHYLLDVLMNGIRKVDIGRLSFSKIDVDFRRLYSVNRYEGSRFGLGLSTNEHLIDFVYFGGYFGYGIADKKWKYGGEIEFMLDRKHDFRVIAAYQNSLKEAGHDKLFYNYFRNSMAYRFDHSIESRVEVQYHISPPWKIRASLNLRKLNPLYECTFQGQPLGEYFADEAQVSLRYAVGERFSLWSRHRFTTSPGNPIFLLTYSRGINRFHSAAPSYHKIEAQADISAYHGRIGKSDIRLEAGYINRYLPYSLMFTGEGCADKLFSFVIKNSFQTMSPYEFLSDRYAHIFFSHNFGYLLLKTKYFTPEVIVMYNAGWGDLSQQTDVGIGFDTKNHVFQETGLLLDNLVHHKIMNVCNLRAGIGGFTRIGAYRYDKFKDNMVFKIRISVTFR